MDPPHGPHRHPIRLKSGVFHHHLNSIRLNSTQFQHPLNLSQVTAPPNLTAMASPTALTFRLATPTDAALLQPLVQSAYRGDSSRLGWTTEANLLAGERISVSGVLSKITAPNSVVLIGTDPSGTLTACCEVVKRSDDVAYFGMFAVDPKRQAGGFGRQVLNYAEEWVRREWGVKRMEMSVIWTRVELIAWYGRRGYRITGERGEFPYHELEDGGKALKEDLHFEILEKVLAGDAKGGVVDEKGLAREEVVAVAA